MVAQQRQKIEQIDRTNAIAAHSTVLRSKQDRLKSLQEMIKVAASIDDRNMVKEYMEQCNKLMNDIKATEDETLSVAQAKSSDKMSSAIAETFLKQGAESMGVQVKVKKRKEKSVFSSSESSSDED